MWNMHTVLCIKIGRHQLPFFANADIGIDVDLYLDKDLDIDVVY